MWETDCPFQVVDHRYIDSLALIRDRLDFLTRRPRLDCSAARPNGSCSSRWRDR